jgi:hypothetical protein
MIWLSANLKVYRFLLPYLPYTKRWGQLKRDDRQCLMKTSY